VKPGDILLCYLVKLSRWCGSLEVKSDAFEDSTPIFADENDPFPIRFKVTPQVMLDFEHAIPIENLWSELSFTNQLRFGSVGWAQAAKLRQSLISISNEDGAAILRALERQKNEPTLFALDQSDVRHIGQRTVVRTEACEVEVEVPDRDVEEETEATSANPRISIKMQALLSQLGAILD
jgi:hypothetical protein